MLAAHNINIFQAAQKAKEEDKKFVLKFAEVCQFITNISYTILRDLF